MKHARALTLLACVLAACREPAADALIGAGGNQPVPSAVLEGAVEYEGPRPLCRYERGRPVAVRGLVVLTLFAYDDPPPPEGSARTALSFATISAARLFPDLRVCASEQPAAQDLVARVRGRATFTWSGVELGRGCDAQGARRGRSYRIHALFDRDESFHPLFSVRNQPTRHDVVGAAYADASAALPRAHRIQVGHLAAHPNGQRVGGIVVTLAEVVETELPIFRVAPEARPLSSEATLPVAVALGDREAFLEARQAAGFAIELVPEQERTRYDAALAAAGVALDYDPSGFVLRTHPLDLDGDGKEDAHPLLPGIPYHAPVLLLERVRTQAEQAAGVPPVVLVGASLDEGADDSARLPVFVAPIAVMRLPRAGGASCDVPVLAPDSDALVFGGAAMRGPFSCQELPTGAYDVHLFSGVRGAAWSIPNELGPVEGEDDERPRLIEQGPAGRYRVFDPEPGNDADRGCEKHRSPPLACACCGSLAALCERRLGPCARDEQGGARLATDSRGQLTCLPFALPPSCCDGTCTEDDDAELPSASLCE